MSKYTTIGIDLGNKKHAVCAPAIRHNNVHPVREEDNSLVGPFVKNCAPW